MSYNQPYRPHNDVFILVPQLRAVMTTLWFMHGRRPYFHEILGTLKSFGGV